MTEIYDKIKGHAVTESNETYRRSLVWKLRTGAATFIERMAADELERLHSEIDWLRTALRAAQNAEGPQSAAEPYCSKNINAESEWLKGDYIPIGGTRPGPGAGRSIDPSKPGPDADRIAFLERQRGLYEMNEADAAIVSDIDEELAHLRGAQSDVEPQTLRDAADNLLLAIGMGWDLEGCAENLRAALTQSDAEPDRELEELVSRWEALKDGGGPSAPCGVLQEELLTIISLARKGLTARWNGACCD